MVIGVQKVENAGRTVSTLFAIHVTNGFGNQYNSQTIISVHVGRDNLNETDDNPCF